MLKFLKKTLSGGFSCVNTRLLFNTELLMPNLTEKDFNKMNIDQSFKAFKRDDLKLVYIVKFDNQKKHEKKRFVTKILKLDENNQYGYSMTKPLPTGCIKESKNFSWANFNILTESVDLMDKIGHLLVVDIFSMQKMKMKSSYFTMKFFHQLLRNRKFLKRTNVLHTNF